MSKLIINTESCKACGYCIKFCPRQVLHFSENMNSQSYTYVEADEENCIYCGTCYTVCPDMVFEITE
ncbi:MAG: ferredoxin family protein [Parasporobacterium sp.]|nr:ferredoxin family protein [Parasporobacterium sp.]